MPSPTNHIDQNQHSDFVILETFVLKGEPQPVDAFNWRLEYFTNDYVKKTAEHRDGVFTNCIKNDDTSVLVVFDNPQFSTGPLHRVAYLEYPNPVFPDGIENIEIPGRTNIVIIKGASTNEGRIENQVILDYVQGGGISQKEFDEAIERLDRKNEEQDEEITSIRQEIAGVEAIQDETIEMIGDGD